MWRIESFRQWLSTDTDIWEWSLQVLIGRNLEMLHTQQNSSTICTDSVNIKGFLPERWTLFYYIKKVSEVVVNHKNLPPIFVYPFLAAEWIPCSPVVMKYWIYSSLYFLLVWLNWNSHCSLLVYCLWGHHCAIARDCHFVVCQLS